MKQTEIDSLKKLVEDLTKEVERLKSLEGRVVPMPYPIYQPPNPWPYFVPYNPWRGPYFYMSTTCAAGVNSSIEFTQLPLGGGQGALPLG